MLITGILWYKRRKAKLELLAQDKIKEERLILSKKVHDVVANGLYQVMSRIEYNDDFSKNEILDKLEMMYQNPEISPTILYLLLKRSLKIVSLNYVYLSKIARGKYLLSETKMLYGIR